MLVRLFLYTLFSLTVIREIRIPYPSVMFYEMQFFFLFGFYSYDPPSRTVNFYFIIQFKKGCQEGIFSVPFKMHGCPKPVNSFSTFVVYKDGSSGIITRTVSLYSGARVPCLRKQDLPVLLPDPFVYFFSASCSVSSLFFVW